MISFLYSLVSVPKSITVLSFDTIISNEGIRVYSLLESLLNSSIS